MKYYLSTLIVSKSTFFILEVIKYSKWSKRCTSKNFEIFWKSKDILPIN